MAIRIKRKFILYLFITAAYLFLWMHTDLAANPGKFIASLINSLWKVIYTVGLNFLYFELILQFVTSARTNRTITVLLFLSSLIIYLIIFAAGIYAWQQFGILINIYNPFKQFSNLKQIVAAILTFSIDSFVVFGFFKLLFDYIQFRYEGQQLRLEKKQAELVFLKAQINPHFLFNTLNNIYSLSQYEPQLVSESILRLSKLLRYMLYETSSDFITIDKEIKILTDYIDLEKLRYSEAVTIDFKSDIENSSEMIPPLLLIPLIENAFKHGVSESRGKRFINIEFVLQKQKLYFAVKNSSDATSNDKKSKENIGLPNLRRRLNLLYKEFDLFTEQKNSIFTAVLKINLSTHV
ncbi:MAG: sensor histidine kinase [Ginsengibacter sp.]